VIMQATIDKFRQLTGTDADLETVDGVLLAIRLWFESRQDWHASSRERLGDENCKWLLDKLAWETSAYIDGTFTVDLFRESLMVDCLVAHEAAVKSGHWDDDRGERSKAKRLGA
jgi:hypothetical protein